MQLLNKKIFLVVYVSNFVTIFFSYFIPIVSWALEIICFAEWLRKNSAFFHDVLKLCISFHTCIQPLSLALLGVLKQSCMKSCHISNTAFIIVEGKCEIHRLKSDPHLPQKTCFIFFHESPLKMMKNVFYFILNALFVLKIFKFLSWLFGHLEKGMIH